MKVLFIDDRISEIERLVLLSGVNHHCEVRTHIFTEMSECTRVAETFDPDIIIIGHGLSAYPITGSQVVTHLRARGSRAKMIANSGSGKYGFDSDRVSIDGSVDRNPDKIAKLCSN